MNYYIYVWFVYGTSEVFYVGRGHGDRYKTLKKRSKYFHEYYDNYPCDSVIIYDGLTEEESKELEPIVIDYFWSIGQAKANIHKGGSFGGDVVTHLPDEEKQNFIEKMTAINRERCSTEKFKKACSERVKKRYEDPSVRKKQSEQQKAIWNEEKREEHSRMTKQRYIDNPNLAKENAKKHWKPCALEFKGETHNFDSVGAMDEYMNSIGFPHLDRYKKIKMLQTGEPYYAYHNKYKPFDGFRIYYRNLETNESSKTCE